MEVNIGTKETQIIYGEKGTIEVAVREDKRKNRVLNDVEISKLIKYGLEIENHYGMPMDIEWAMKDDVIYILQARAITTLANTEKSMVEDTLVEQYIKKQKIKKDTQEMMAFFLEKIPFAYRALEFDYLMAISNQKANILREVGIVFPKNPIIDNDGIQTFSDRGKRINRNIFQFFKFLKNMKDFDTCYQKCNDFMKIYESKIENMKELNFEIMTLEECKKFMEESYTLLQKLAYDRFKYALFPSVLNSKKLNKIIKKVNTTYSSFDFYWNLNNKTSVVTDHIWRRFSDII